MTFSEQNKHKKRAEQPPLSNSTSKKLINISYAFDYIPKRRRFQWLGGLIHGRR